MKVNSGILWRLQWHRFQMQDLQEVLATILIAGEIVPEIDACFQPFLNAE